MQEVTDDSVRFEVAPIGIGDIRKDRKQANAGRLCRELRKKSLAVARGDPNDMFRAFN